MKPITHLDIREAKGAIDEIMSTQRDRLSALQSSAQQEGTAHGERSNQCV